VQRRGALFILEEDHAPSFKTSAQKYIYAFVPPLILCIMLETIASSVFTAQVVAALPCVDPGAWKITIQRHSPLPAEREQVNPAFEEPTQLACTLQFHWNKSSVHQQALTRKKYTAAFPPAAKPFARKSRP